MCWFGWARCFKRFIHTFINTNPVLAFMMSCFMMVAATQLPYRVAAASQLPHWATTVPNVTLRPSAGLTTPKGVTHATVYRAAPTFGAYNHGPILTQHSGLYVMSWYNGVLDESVKNRVLFATSTDAVKWSSPRVLFNTTAGWHRGAAAAAARARFPSGYDIGLENEPWLVGPVSGSLYAVASSWDVFQRKGHGAEHTGPDAALVRRLTLSTSATSDDGAEVEDAVLGPVFWLADRAPPGFERYCNVTQHDAAAIGADVVADMAAVRSRLISTVAQADASEPNERSLYALPPRSSHASDGNLDLVLLLRSGVDEKPRIWASTAQCHPRHAAHHPRHAAPVVESAAHTRRSRSQPSEETASTRNADATAAESSRGASASAAPVGVGMDAGASCRPGTGIYNFGLLPPTPRGDSGAVVRAAATSGDGGDHDRDGDRDVGNGGGDGDGGGGDGDGGSSSNGGDGDGDDGDSAWICSAWSTPAPTNIPDSHSRTCTAQMVDGRVWMVGAQLPLSGDRTPLTLSLSSDGVAWDSVWSVRGCGAPRLPVPSRHLP